jgi:glycosyltransferase involved in cell wall biosynthesis
MSRICLIATGVPSEVESDIHHGPGLRASHFAAALGTAECEVLVVAILPQGDRNRGRLPSTFMVAGREVGLVETTEKELGDGALAARIASFSPDAFVGVSAMASAMACGLVGDLPLWADLFGDLMAEAQAKAAVYDNDSALPRFWGMLAQSLERADCFSAVSSRQGDALVGQLGMAGRLSKATMAEELVHVIPCAPTHERLADDARVARLRRELGLEGAFVVLSSGSFNTWCDVDVLYETLVQAMRGCPTLHFVATGGPVAGHDERSYERFAARVSDGAFSDRFHLVGWRPASELPVYYGLADLGLNVERSCYERRLGSENRVVEWLAAGVPVLSTALSEQGRELAGRNVIHRVDPGVPESIASALVELEADRGRLADLARNGSRYAAESIAPETTAASLVAWALDPRRASDSHSARLIRIGLVSEPKTMVALLESYVDELGTAELVRRGARWIWRRSRRG